MGMALPFDLLTANYATFPNNTGWTPGQKLFDERTGKWYRFVQAGLDSDNSSLNTLVQGRPMYYMDSTKAIVFSGVATGVTKVLAGVLNCTVTTQTGGAASLTGMYYTWITVEGDLVPCLVTSGVTAGAPLVADLGAAGVLAAFTAGDAETQCLVGQYFGWRQTAAGGAYTAGTAASPVSPNYLLSQCYLRGR
jgi:hypothetical protein